MKKNLLFILLALTCTMAFGQKISKDYRLNNGYRFIDTYGERLRETNVLSRFAKALGDRYCLQVIATPRDTTYYLTVTLLVPDAIDDGRVMLLKLDNGEVITLKNTRHATKYRAEEEYDGEVAVSSAMYPITPAQIKKLQNRKVRKFRIVTERDVIDSETYKRQFSEYLPKAYLNIRNLLQKGTGQNDPYEGF